MQDEASTQKSKNGKKARLSRTLVDNYKSVNNLPKESILTIDAC